MKSNIFYSAGITIDVVVFTIHQNQLKTLLIKRAWEPFENMLSLPGGFLQKEETLDEGAARILLVKGGVKNVFTEQLYTFDGDGRDPRGKVISVAYFALVPHAETLIHESQTTQQPELVPVRQLPNLAFDHTRIVDYAVSRLEAKIEYTNAVYSLLPKEFTLTELQKTYEIILNRPLDKRNFRKKFLSLGLIEPSGNMSAKSAHRPAKLYRFCSTKPTELARWF